MNEESKNEVDNLNKDQKDINQQTLEKYSFKEKVKELTSIILSKLPIRKNKVIED